MPAHRVRRGRREPLGGLRDPGRHDPSGPPAGDRPPGGRQELHQGAEQGDPQGHGQDGDLGAPELLRRADLRGHRPRQGRGRPLLHGHALPGQRDRPRRHRRGGAPPARARVPRPARSAPRSSTGAASTSGAATASSTCSTPRRCSSSSTRRGAVSTRSSRSTRAPWTSRAGTWPRSEVCSPSGPARRRCRSTRWSRSSRSSGTSPRAPCPTARSARRPTRRSPSR